MSRLARSFISNIQRMSARNASEWGSGSGKGGGAGGSVREAGGAFGKMEAAQEEHYFRKQQKAQLEKMKEALDSHKKDIEAQIKEHEKELERLHQMVKK